MRGRAPDIHFVPDYARSFEKHEGGRVEVFHFDGRYGGVDHLFLKRPIEGAGGYSDIITPYGYGGPVVTRCEQGLEEALVAEYRAAFDAFCEDQKIICAFTRFHPLFDNARAFEACYDRVVPIRNIVIVDLSRDVFYDEFSRAPRRAYERTAADGDIEILYDEHCERLDDFLDIYYATMDKNGAQDYYYFSRDYFLALIADNPGNIMLVHACLNGEIVSSLLFLRESGILYFQFGGTKPNCYESNGQTAILAHCACKYAQDPHYTHLVLGGGHTNDPGDLLLRYKKKFSKSLHKFHTGTRVYDREAYAMICTAAGVDPAGPSGFFPAYRQR